ncbi:pyruvate carboxylase subunit B [Dethiosulfatarculus sandiegensis]|uniref:Carboxylase n=1 Tax=Dethiosulfatarculus sandiegensis TaxID=1429043 RepID=A0A0D2JVP8_9BACT|nr:pyruvate carboxylase subunit B [Dethiosulfatarculus sandiegensis]KIX13660.1 carboxylase [Dethiosulfatarculus sandiegensis]
MSNDLWNGNTAPLKIQDLTLRDGHQSLFATRMRTEDMVPIAEQLDEAGFWALEVWGGATFDSMSRFLGEDPWERPRILRKYAKNTPFSMLLRGQNLVGYRNYADDVAREFVDKSCEAGINVFRVFDALNDYRNFETVVERIKANGQHFQGTICYSLTERKLGGEVFSLAYYLDKARQLVEMGADTICVKDMAGLIAPYDAYTLIKALKEKVDLPLHLHTHYTSGMASMSCLKAAEAGVDIIDCCLAPFALRTSHPAVEPMIVAMEGTPRDTGMDLKAMLTMGEHLEKIAPKYRDYMATNRMATIDTGVLVHQVPGGMISNLVSQLKQAGALDRLPEVYAEVAQARKDLGTPPLVTPTSQIVGVQSVLNVLFGRYKMVTNQVKDLVYGLYGKTPTKPDPEVRAKCLRGYSRGTEPFDGRPADVLEPEMEAAKKRVADIPGSDDWDVMTSAIYDVTGTQFVKIKRGVEEMPAEMKGKTLEDVAAEDKAMDDCMKEYKKGK